MILIRLRKELLAKLKKLAKQPTVEDTRSAIHEANEARLDVWRVDQMKNFTKSTIRK